MRYRVDLRYGYASFDATEEHKAVALYEAEGLCLRLCHGLHDDGTVVAGFRLGEWANA